VNNKPPRRDKTPPVTKGPNSSATSRLRFLFLPHKAYRIPDHKNPLAGDSAAVFAWAKHTTVLKPLQEENSCLRRKKDKQKQNKNKKQTITVDKSKFILKI